MHHIGQYANGYEREDQKETVEPHIGIAICAVGAWIHSDAARTDCRRGAGTGFYHPVPARPCLGFAKLTLGEKALC